jgi:hypothetical protein
MLPKRRFGAPLLQEKVDAANLTASRQIRPRFSIDGDEKLTHRVVRTAPLEKNLIRTTPRRLDRFAKKRSIPARRAWSSSGAAPEDRSLRSLLGAHNLVQDRTHDPADRDGGPTVD